MVSTCPCVLHMKAALRARTPKREAPMKIDEPREASWSAARQRRFGKLLAPISTKLPYLTVAFPSRLAASCRARRRAAIMLEGLALFWPAMS